MSDMSLIDDVRDIVACIPPGRVTTYGDIGAAVGVGARQVGRTMPLLDESVPWWRVVHADGTPATCHGGTALDLLRSEGTPTRGRRVDMVAATSIKEPTMSAAQAADVLTGLGSGTSGAGRWEVGASTRCSDG